MVKLPGDDSKYVMMTVFQFFLKLNRKNRFNNKTEKENVYGTHNYWPCLMYFSFCFYRSRILLSVPTAMHSVLCVLTCGYKETTVVQPVG